MKIRFLEIPGEGREDLLEAVARARGCRTAEEIEEFLEPAPPIRDGVSRLPGYPAALERIRRAIQENESIVLFGDYDCDGITSIVQMFDFFQAAGHTRSHWFVPDRLLHDYGLTRGAAEECIRRHEPALFIALDCGSNARETIRALKDRGIDSIVVDHHELAPEAAAQPGRQPSGEDSAGRCCEDHPALALLNPRASDPSDPLVAAMQEMSASGLTYLFCRRLARDLGISAWPEDRACILAGVGTVVDVMPLRRINRALVKAALRLANTPESLARIPGLVALQELAPAPRVDVRTLGFRWGPRLNASGRLEDASHPVHMLLARDLASARPLAARCDAANTERQDLQKAIEKSAAQMAEERVTLDPPDRALLLHHPDWHAGIVGIVASRLKERYTRPVVVCARHPDGYWKGSGRSPDGFDLGLAVQDAVKSGVLLGGGGHAHAAGVRIADDALESFRRWLNERCILGPEDFRPVHEVLAPLEAISEDASLLDARRVQEEWCTLLAPLEPFGAGNPRPSLLLRQAELRWGPKEKTRRGGGEPWALSAGFSFKGSGYLFAEWTDVRRARATWEPGGRYDLLLSPSSSPGTDRRTGRTTIYYNLRVTDCERVG